jgi:fumarylacetoacetate (FAA) hydrolase
MKLVSFLDPKGRERLGAVVKEETYDLHESGERLGISLPATMAELLTQGEVAWARARQVLGSLVEGRGEPLDGATLKPLAPVPHPTSCRDGYAFRQHVATARRNRGLEMIPEFDEFPVFYFTNHHGIIGAGVLEVEADHLRQLDFELEAAIVIGRGGRNIAAEDADAHIAGLMVMNDFSARQLQMEEMKLNLGPAKGKDFATAIGPWLVTLDELEDRRIRSPRGSRWDLSMGAWHNGRQISQGNLKQMDWTFAELIERASYGVDLLPGDVIGSGTVGTGCYLELNGTWALEAKAANRPFAPTWLQVGDSIELEIDRLGRLKHTVARASQERSLLAKKRQQPGRS